jgi:hypothetical protein
MAEVINELGDQLAAGVPLWLGEPIRPLLRGRRLVLRAVHRAWADTPLFAVAGRFYRTVPPVLQVVWGTDAEDLRRQPQLWLAPGEHPDSDWLRFDPPPWPFHATGPGEAVFTTERVLGGAPIARVQHLRDGSWEFLDSADATPGDAVVLPLGRLFELRPDTGFFSDLPRSHQTWCHTWGHEEAWLTMRLRSLDEHV